MCGSRSSRASSGRPPTDGTGRQTRWFYERARGQYADALAREGTPARQREFKLRHPSPQRMAKTDLAKFENTWDQLPHIVSRGAQKSFVHFMERLEARGRFEPDAEYLRALVAKAILFKRTERLVTEQNFGGYRANIVDLRDRAAVPPQHAAPGPRSHLGAPGHRRAHGDGRSSTSHIASTT